MMKQLLGLMVFFTVVAGFPAEAQPRESTFSVNVGDRVSVMTPSGERLEGMALQIAPDTIVLKTPAGIQTVPYVHLRRVQRRDRSSKAPWTGAIAGFIVGFRLAQQIDCNDDSCRRAEVNPFVAGLYTAMVGAGMELAIRSAEARSRPVHRSSGVTVAVGPRRGGAVATVTASW